MFLIVGGAIKEGGSATFEFSIKWGGHNKVQGVDLLKISIKWGVHNRVGGVDERKALQMIQLKYCYRYCTFIYFLCHK